MLCGAAASRLIIALALLAEALELAEIAKPHATAAAVSVFTIVVIGYLDKVTSQIYFLPASQAERLDYITVTGIKSGAEQQFRYQTSNFAIIAA